MSSAVINDWTDIDALCRFDAPIASSSSVPRWKRKEMEAKAGAKTPSRGSDRFISCRTGMDSSKINFGLKENDNPAAEEMYASPSKEEYKSTLANTLFSGNNAKKGAKVLAFRNKAPAAPEGYQNSLKVLYSQNKAQGIKKKSMRHIPQAPERILDAPELLDDYYLNLLSWNQNNILAIALGYTVYLWNASDGSITELLTAEDPDHHITSVDWIQDGNYLAVGTNGADVQLWDTEAIRQVRCMKGHRARVGALAWNQHILSSGSRDSTIINHDVRIAEHRVASLEGHTQEVCGLKWSPDGTQLASGSNDNLLNIWDVNQAAPKFSLDHHTAAVKALAWCPWQPSLLASGGGTADRSIRFWNTQTGACLNSIDTKSQVCSIQWSVNQKELVSSHGFSQNQLIVWKYPTMAKVAELTGHTSRVLHMALSPDGETIASAAGDETLRFWKIFANEGKNKETANKKVDVGGLSSLGGNRNIR